MKKLVLSGFVAGVTFLMVYVILETVFSEVEEPVETRIDDVQVQVWKVLAEARKITEEACDGV